jgi:hypothetical protein
MKAKAMSIPARRWSVRAARSWYEKQPWIVGCNFLPSSAVNQLEMWQAATFDLPRIERELGWAAGLGFNAVRVYLHDLVWENEQKKFKERLDRVLAAADTRGIRVLPVLFDDCWNDHPKAGPQPEPVPGVHNSGWVRSPGSTVVTHPRLWGRLRRYVTDVLGSFAQDKRVLLWDLYNEPGNSKMDEASLPLLREVFKWAREVRPSQPLTAGVWYANQALNDFQLGASDVITFHQYNGLAEMKRQVAELKALGRPVICTEYMARPASRFATHLPLLKKEQVGAVSWGLVAGRSQTRFPWGSPEGAPEPEPWFHDILEPDGTPYDAAEFRAIRKLTLPKAQPMRNA